MTGERQLSPDEWPYPRDEFVRASRLQEATDDEVRRAIEAQAFTIIRNATRKAVLRIVSTFERGSLPDEDEGLTDEIDSAIEQFGLERKIHETEENETGESDSSGVRIDFD